MGKQNYSKTKLVINIIFRGVFVIACRAHIRSYKYRDYFTPYTYIYIFFIIARFISGLIRPLEQTHDTCSRKKNNNICLARNKL